MDDLSVFETSYDICLNDPDIVLKRCIKTNLVLNCENVTEGIMLGYKISSRGIVVDKAKI